MKLLTEEAPLLVLPQLAERVGLNEAIVLQQLHYRSRLGVEERSGRRWVKGSYEVWQQEFPFWSLTTVRRTLMKLEDKGYIQATQAFNRSRNDHTKWYTLCYTELVKVTGSKWMLRYDHIEHKGLVKLDGTISKDIKDIKKYYIALTRDVILFLNDKADKTFNPESRKSQRLVTEVAMRGYTYDDFIAVIEAKVKTWQDTPYARYLRPSTLFGLRFESYLKKAKPAKKAAVHEVVLDFEEGEG